MTAIVNQHIESFIGYGAKPEGEYLISPKGKKIKICTWQAIYSKLKAGCIPNAGLVIFDEAHKGGSKNDNVSIPKIKSGLGGKWVNVSATIQPASEKLLGQKAGHTFVYPMSQAYADGFLNDLDLIEIETGTTAQIAKIESAYGKNFEKIEEMSSKDLKDLSNKLIEKDIEIGDEAVKKIINHRHDTMMDFYFRNHSNEQALFFCPSIVIAEAACKRFKARSNVSANYMHSEQPDDSALEDFKNGNTRILFVVGMLQEGFDMPSLELAFDCRFYRSWDKNRIARFTQKVGRLLRIAEGKGTSKYYFARDLHDYKNGYSPEDLAEIGLNSNPMEGYEEETETLSDEEFLEQAATAAAQYVDANNHSEDADEETRIWDNEQEIEQSEIQYNENGLRSVTTRVIGVSGGQFGKIYKFRDLLGGNSDKAKAELLAIPVGSPRPHKTTSLSRRLGSYLYKNGSSYDSIFDKKIRERQPNWFYENKTEFFKSELLAMPVESPRPASRSFLGSKLMSYISKNTKMYDSVFDKQIREKHPDWFVNKADKAKAELLAMPVGSRCPHFTTSLGIKLKHYTAKNDKMFDPIFDKQIREKHPDWFGIPADVIKAELLDMPVGSPRPYHKSILGIKLKIYISKNGNSYDSVFDKQIREKHPDWFVKTADKAKAELLAMPVGSPRPHKTTSLGMKFGSYLYKKHRSYDPNFDKQIREKFPHWFKK